MSKEIIKTRVTFDTFQPAKKSVDDLKDSYYNCRAAALRAGAALAQARLCAPDGSGLRQKLSMAIDIMNSIFWEESE